MKRWTWPTAVAVGVLGIMFLVFWQGQVQTPRTRTDAASIEQSDQTGAVKTAFANGMQAMMSAGTPSTGQQHRMLSLRKTTLSRSSLSQPELTTLEQTGRVALAKYFTTQEMSDAQKSLMGMLAMDRDPNQINQGAGVSKIRYQDVTVRGDNANIGADVTAWAKSLVRQSPQGSWLATAPVSTMHFTATLVRQPSGQWQISSLFGAFAPGEGP